MSSLNFTLTSRASTASSSAFWAMARASSAVFPPMFSPPMVVPSGKRVASLLTAETWELSSWPCWLQPASSAAPSSAAAASTAALRQIFLFHSISMTVLSGTFSRCITIRGPGLVPPPAIASYYPCYYTFFRGKCKAGKRFQIG